MTSPFQAVKISENVHWVGAVDWAVRDFHGYATSRGTTYNAYLVNADKVTLVDTVKKPFKDEMLARISSVVEPEKIDYIVSNHSEMDHSGCLKEVAALVRPEKIFASTNGKKALQDHFRMGDDVTAVKTGDSISLGNMNLSFVETRMLHWPDSMVSFLDADGVLFSQDAFGMHLATCERWADEIPDWVLEYEVKKYFANILLPFTMQVAKTVDAIPGLGFDIKIIAPDHGPLWRKNLDKITGLYRELAENKRRDKAVVVYDTMWGSTATMAQAVGEAISSSGSCVKIMNLRADHRSDVATEMLGAGALVVGSPTINNNIFPTVADVMVYLKGLKVSPALGAAFGSFGWSGEAVKHLNKLFEEMKIETPFPEGVRIKYVPDEEGLLACRELGREISKKIKESI